MIAGFDPRYQFIHADDVVEALEFAVEHDLPGIHNGAGRCPALSEIIGLLGKRALPCCRRGAPARRPLLLCRARLRLPPEMLLQLRYGRGLDNRRLKGRASPCVHDPRDRTGVRRASAPEGGP